MAAPRHVYVHVPFCARRCVYCDFAIAVRRVVPAEAFVESVLAELQVRAVPRGEVDTLYFGGGTPSQLGGPAAARLVHRLTEWFPLAAGAEVTLEANPEDVTRATARQWAASGINRISLGVQSFDDRVLAWMHRGHDAPRVQRAVDDLREAGIVNLSLDLIYAVPAELGRDWRRDLDAALAMAPDHLSCYGLTVEPRTPLGRQVARGARIPAPEESHEGEFLTTHDVLTAAGFEHYEVSNYGRPGRRSAHNASYWSGVPYLGLGPSAHGFDGAARRWNEPALRAWEAALGALRDPLEGSEVLTEDQRRLEEIYLGLRTQRGTAITAVDAPLADRWVEEGWAIGHPDRLRLTPSGWLRLDALVAALTDHRSRY
jgi:oxygen-independent coproporphyrinogen-3 oxidase